MIQLEYSSDSISDGIYIIPQKGYDVMQRLFAMLLCIGLLASLVLPAGAMESSPSPMSIVAEGIDPQAVDTDRLIRASAGKRAEAEDNLVFPGPLVTQCSFTPSGATELLLGVYSTGKSGQYMCMMIYAGTDLNSEPIAVDYAPFPKAEGFSTQSLVWKKNNIPTGRYTLVTFTAVVKSGTLYAVDETAFLADLYVYETFQQRWRSFVTYPDVWEKLDTIRLPLGETTVLAAGRSPLPSYGSEKVSLKGDLIRTEEAGGYFFVTPYASGNGTTTFYYGSGMAKIPIEVCYYDDGHRNTESIPAGEPTRFSKGYTLKICEGCGTVTRVATPSYCNNFDAFQDIPEGSWYSTPVYEAVCRNLFNGVNTTTFGPDRAMTRAMLVTVLWRYEGQPGAASADFTDVASKDWFASAVNWAAEQEIVNGVGKGKFNPNGTITREQLATILFRYAQKKGLDIAVTGDPGLYPDAEDLSTWATEGMSWALGRELISGVGKGGKIYLTPKGNATRAQVATILVRFIENLVEYPVYPDLSTAVDGGTITATDSDHTFAWAFYESGLLQISGNDLSSYNTIEDTPWNGYRNQITKIEFLPGTTIVRGVFKEYPVLESVIMADSVTTIGNEAFYKCPKLTDIRFPSSLTTIGESAFRQCKSLKAIHIPDGCPVVLEPYSFADNIALEVVDLGNNARRIGNYAFKKCTALREIALPDSILDFEGNAYTFYTYGVGTHGFYGCKALETVKLPMGMMTIASATFYDCTSLTTVETPFALNKMENAVFRNCSALESVAFPPAFRVLYAGSFVGCSALKELYFFNDLLSLNKYNFIENSDEDLLPFGDPQKVVIYGIPGSSVQVHAETYGHEFRDITELLA